MQNTDQPVRHKKPVLNLESYGYKEVVLADARWLLRGFCMSAGTGATVVCALSYCSEADDTDAYHIFISYRVKSEAALAKQLYHCYYQSAMALRTSRSIHMIWLSLE